MELAKRIICNSEADSFRRLFLYIYFSYFYLCYISYSFFVTEQRVSLDWSFAFLGIRDRKGWEWDLRRRKKEQ